MEVYAVDIDATKGLVIYGGENDGAELYSYRDDIVVSKVEELAESVLFTKFVGDGRFVIVTIDGTIALMEQDRELCVVDIKEDVSAVHFNGLLVVGTESGHVYVYDAELEHKNTCGGHRSAVLCVDYREDRVLSLSAESFVAHDVFGGALYTFRAQNATAFRYIAGDVFCLARDNRVQIFKETKKLFETTTDDAVEAIELLGKNLVLGGAFEHVLLIDTTHHYAIFRLEVGVHIHQIRPVDDNRIVFSTACGQIGLLDIRNAKSLRLFEGGVQTIYDFGISGSDVIVGGEAGMCMFNLNGEQITAQVADSVIIE